MDVEGTERAPTATRGIQLKEPAPPSLTNGAAVKAVHLTASSTYLGTQVLVLTRTIL